MLKIGQVYYRILKRLKTHQPQHALRARGADQRRLSVDQQPCWPSPLVASPRTTGNNFFQGADPTVLARSRPIPAPPVLVAGTGATNAPAIAVFPTVVVLFFCGCSCRREVHHSVEVAPNAGHSSAGVGWRWPPPRSAVPPTPPVPLLLASPAPAAAAAAGAGAGLSSVLFVPRPPKRSPALVMVANPIVCWGYGGGRGQGERTRASGGHREREREREEHRERERGAWTIEKRRTTLPHFSERRKNPSQTRT